MICNMDSIGKYMLDIILHQQRTPQLLKQKKLMQTQEDHSNTVQALNSHGALDLGSTRYMKNEGTVRVLEGTARRYCSKVLLLFESTAHYAQSTARCESTAVMFEDDIVQCIFLDGFESQMLRLRGR
ncbi:hypothetical protein Tco_0672446 [Tanacetum coccineum]